MFSSPFPDVEIPDLSVFDYLFGSLDDASAELAGVAADSVVSIGQVDGGTSLADLVGEGRNA